MVPLENYSMPFNQIHSTFEDTVFNNTDWHGTIPVHTSLYYERNHISSQSINMDAFSSV
jgi:hypothetical protein